MLTQIKLTNFKCFKEETTFPLSKFNLFTGINGSGKSTLLQSLLLMRQSIEHIPITDIILNGNCVSLGCFDDVRNRKTSRKESIYFEFVYDNNKDITSVLCHLDNKTRDEMILYMSTIDIYQYENANNKLKLSTLKEGEEGGVVGYISVFILDDPSEMKAYSSLNYFEVDFKRIHFISADRIGPQEFYFKYTLPKFLHVGTKGEFTVNLLDKLAQELVNETLCLGDDARTLITQTQAWLGKILNPLKLEVPRSKTNILELFFDDFKPANVGFGYSSLLPIIVTGLIAKPDEKIIIENPEIHLHPKAQSALIDFLVKVANTGVQIFIESHSDHVLNALRVATKENRLSSEDTSILFFATNPANNANDITSILIDEKGKLHKKSNEGSSAKIPKGFFDEWTNSMAKLF